MTLSTKSRLPDLRSGKVRIFHFAEMTESEVSFCRRL